MSIYRNSIALGALAFMSLVMLVSLIDLSLVIDHGISLIYNQIGPKIAPNMITVILFDLRGYDTLGECLVLVSGVLITSLIFGRGILHEFKHDKLKGTDLKTTPILDYFTPLLILLVFALGVYITLGGHITPGGGFQGGSLIAAGILFGLAIYGRKSIVEFDHSILIRLETLGVLTYILIGLIGLITGGFFLYNIGTDLYELSMIENNWIFNYPDITQAGVIPYLNIAVLLKVSAGLATILLVLVGVKK